MGNDPGGGRPLGGSGPSAGRGMRTLIRPHVETIPPYVPARARYAGGILLDANENPYGPPFGEIEGAVHRYPDPENRRLRSALADWLELEADDRLWLGNGSDEVLDVLVRTVVDPGQTVVITAPSYGMYLNRAAAHGAAVRLVPLDDAFDLDVEAVAAAATGARLIILCSPNNPTGNCLSRDRVLRLIDSCDALVAVDEAYVEFATAPSLATMAGRAERLAVVRTFSKAWGLAGARVGYLVGARRLVEAMRRVGLPYPLSTPAARSAVEALARADVMKQRRDRIVAERERVEGAIRTLGLRVLPSDANFLLFFVPDAEAFQAALVDRYGIVVRNRSRLPALAGALRVTIGTPAENDSFLEALGELARDGLRPGRRIES